MASKRVTGIVEPALVREDLRRHIGDAFRRLRDHAALSDQQIHSARKDLKRARAGVRLLRAVVGKRAYSRENAALRDASRPLGAVRDSKVVMETLDALLKTALTPSQRAVLQALHVEMEKVRHAAHEALHGSGALAASATVLESEWKRVDGWAVARKDASRLHEGLERVYRSGRKALARIEADPTPENFHEWRKQVKYLANAVDILRQSETQGFRKLLKRAHAVAQALGDDHDLVVLQGRIAGVHAGSHNAHRALTSRIAARREALQSKGLKKGRRLYKLKPKAFIERIQRESRRALRKRTAAQAAAQRPVAVKDDTTLTAAAAPK